MLFAQHAHFRCSWLPVQEQAVPVIDARQMLVQTCKRETAPFRSISTLLKLMELQEAHEIVCLTGATHAIHGDDCMCCLLELAALQQMACAASDACQHHWIDATQRCNPVVLHCLQQALRCCHQTSAVRVLANGHHPAYSKHNMRVV